MLDQQPLPGRQFEDAVAAHLTDYAIFGIVTE
jgi:hypothetical protein